MKRILLGSGLVLGMAFSFAFADGDATLNLVGHDPASSGFNSYGNYLGSLYATSDALFFGGAVALLGLLLGGFLVSVRGEKSYDFARICLAITCITFALTVWGTATEGWRWRSCAPTAVLALISIVAQSVIIRHNSRHRPKATR